VVQNDVGNRQSDTTVVAAITRTLPRRPYPFVVVVEADESGLPTPSAVNCSQLATIQQTVVQSRLRAPRGETLLRPIGRLTADKLAEIDDALRFSLGLAQ
jgi:mRNA interferase MazF